MTGGILSIVAGAGQVIGGIVFTVMAGAITRIPDIPGMVPGIFTVVAIPLIILGIVAIIGGIYALKRRIWGLALAGSICALVGPWILGIPAIVFIAMGKNEFK